jgi:hypothetical protein
MKIGWRWANWRLEANAAAVGAPSFHRPGECAQVARLKLLK